MRFLHASRRGVATAAFVAASALASSTAGQVAELDLRSQVFFEPSSESDMLVLAPSATIAARPVQPLRLHAGYSADIVSGATESVKAGRLLSATPDIVSRASITDHRHIVSGGAGFEREHARIAASFTHGRENDYRSNSFQVTAGTDFFQRNTELEIAYAHGFDEVCDLSINRDQDPTLRLSLDSSDGCFTDDEDRRTVDISIDNFQAGWTQAWTPVFATQVVATTSIQRGLLGNPYRAVVIGPTGESAQEHHPEHRLRTSVAVRFKYYVRPIETAFGLGLRGYRDTWEVESQTVELDAERNIFSWLRLQVHGRFYNQSEAIFWSDDYTGGEPRYGVRGQYFSGDRELSPLKSVLGGGRLTASFHGAPGSRIGSLFLDLEATAGADVVKTFLEDFTWAGSDPDDTFALIGAASVTATF